MHSRTPKRHEQYQLVCDFLFHFNASIVNLINVSILTQISCRSVEHDHVKANLLAKLLRICTFGKMELSGFKKLISAVDYKTYKETKKSWQLPYLVPPYCGRLCEVPILGNNLYRFGFGTGFSCLPPYASLLLLQRELAAASDVAARLKRKSTPVARRPREIFGIP